MTETEFRFRLEALEKDVSEIRQEAKEFRKVVYERLNKMEVSMQRIPSTEELDLIKAASAYYKSKKELTDKILHTLITRGIVATAIFLGGYALYHTSNILLGK
jgi:hypothetical protein